jgi:beta-lactamase class A
MSYFHKIIFYFTIALFSNTCLAGQAQFDKVSIQEKLAQLESKYHVRLGIAAVNIDTNEAINYRADERFPIQSTFKLIGVSAVLYRSIADPSLLNQKIFYNKSEVVTWSPITGKNINNGMTILELSAAAMMYSDNTAINLLVKKLGGFNKVIQFARFIKNDSFRLDHFEPNMNSDPSRLEDTSTPNDMQFSLQKIIFSKILSVKQRELLVDWMKQNTTGDTKIRAGVPKGWVVADKTGSGSYGISNDLGIIWPPNRPPIILVIYSVQNDKNATHHDEILAVVTRLVCEAYINSMIVKSNS